jgi:hypothetical protein
MTNFDLFLLTIYFLCVTYVLYQMINSFNDECIVSNEKDKLTKLLEDLKLDDRIEISFMFDKRYEFHKLQSFGVNVKNKSSEYPIYVDWSCSSITDFDNKSRRLTRSIPGNTLDLFPEQSLSPIAPGTTLKEKVAAEDMLVRKGDEGPMEIGKDKTLQDLTKPKKPGDALNRYNAFMSLEENLNFSMSLMLRIVNEGTPSTGYGIPIKCEFTIKKLHWMAGLPWNPKES